MSLWELVDGPSLGIIFDTFAGHYAYGVRRELGLNIRGYRGGRKRATPVGERPARKLPPPAKYVPPRYLKGRPLSREELARERRAWLKRRERREA